MLRAVQMAVHAGGFEVREPMHSPRIVI